MYYDDLMLLTMIYESYTHYVKYMWIVYDVWDNVCNDIIISCDLLAAMLLFTLNKVACVGPRCSWCWDV